MVLAEGLGNGLLLMMVILAVGMAVVQRRRMLSVETSLDKVRARNAAHVHRIFAAMAVGAWVILNGFAYRRFHLLNFFGKTVRADVIAIRAGDERMKYGGRIILRAIDVPVIEAVWDGRVALHDVIENADLEKLQDGRPPQVAFVVLPEHPTVHMLGDRPTVSTLGGVGGAVLVLVLGAFFAVGVIATRRARTGVPLPP